MKKIKIADVTLREGSRHLSAGLSFKEKIEIVKQLENLGADVIETGYVTEAPADAVFVRTAASMVENAAVSVPVPFDRAGIDRTWDALSKAKNPRLNVIAPTSTVQMEYLQQMKAEAMLRTVEEAIAHAAALCPHVEFTAEDATRAEPEFLTDLIKAAIGAGAKTITLCDSTGEALPGEIISFIAALRRDVSALENVEIAIHLKNNLGLAASCALSAVSVGAAEVKVSAGSAAGTLPLEQFLSILKNRGEALSLTCGANLTAMQRICRQLGILAGQSRAGLSPISRIPGGDETEPSGTLALDADMETVAAAVAAMGYDISGEDLSAVYAQFREIARGKPVDHRELEAIIAETAGQVPPTYTVGSFVINSGSAITSTALICLQRAGAEQQALSMGDGPIDAAFLAIEQALGRHFELDDFQIGAVTEGREAMGSALVKLRSEGRLYSGRGLSTDIIEASIRAYISAVNKIVYEEKGQ